MKINKVNPVGLANLTAITTAIMVFIVLLLVTLLGGLLGGILGAGAAGPGAIDLLGGGVIVMLVAPPIYGVITWIFTIFYALILNLALKWSGGLQIDTSE